MLVKCAQKQFGSAFGQPTKFSKKNAELNYEKVQKINQGKQAFPWDLDLLFGAANNSKHFDCKI